MFRLGSAECKIAMGGLKASDMAAYMRALGGHTLKSYRQCLSAAFNLNTPLIDDIRGKYYTDSMKIARRAIKLAALGGFGKVTWDGASDSYPSVPLLQSEGMPSLLSLRNAKELVHLAHAAGLLTYFSAGFREEHIKITVYSGVDGIGGVTSSVASRYHLLIIIIGNMIGISGAQVLRSMDRETGMHGEYLESRIDKLIDERDTAAQNVFGRAAKLLARLNKIYYEGSITAPELGEWNALCPELDQEKPDEISLEISLLRKFLKSPKTGLLEKQHKKPSLLEEYYTKEFKDYNEDDWPVFSETLASILKATDLSEHGFKSKLGNISTVEGNIHSLSMSPLWKKLRRAYREKLAKQDGKHIHKASKAPKATPFETSQALVISDLFKTKNAKKKK
ncbi:hypothetical protein FRC11_011598 [Ceratobasidium sp. 423]|nr:hypothetical protein FRC11_011598 [Ceratobasidium sp. 423]